MTRRTNVKSESWDDESLPIRTTNDDTKKISAETKSGNILKRRKIEQSFPTIDEEENEPSGVEVILQKKCDKEKHFQKLREKRGHRSSINKPRSRKPPFSFLLQAGLILLVIHGYAATENVTVRFPVNVKLDTLEVVYGQNVSILCIAQTICIVNSWSIRYQKGTTYETVTRESRSFYPTQYGAHLVKEENATRYELFVYNLDKDDLYNDYRCECDDNQGYLTDINDQLKVVNGTKNRKDLSHTELIVGIISGIGSFFIVLVCGIYHCRKRIKSIKSKGNDEESSTSNEMEPMSNTQPTST